MTVGSAADGVVPVIAHLADIADRYDALFCDVWGVLHDGVREYAAAGDALERYRAQGGVVVLVTNAPVPETQVARILAQKSVRRSAWDAIVSSGDVTRHLIAERGASGVFHIGPDRDLSLFRDPPVPQASVEAASVAVVTALVDEEREQAEDYRPLLEKMRARNLDLVCANPDRVVHVGDRLIPCAGALADLYEELGGTVIWAGKPYAPIYELALAKAQTTCSDLKRDRVLMIGDSLKTDIAGAAAFGVDALFVARGIHRDETLDPASLRRLLRDAGVCPIGATHALAW